MTAARSSTQSVNHLRQRRSAWPIARLLPLALAAVFFVLSAPAAHADNPPIATVGLTPGWITFGQAVPQGAAHDGGLKIGALETQTDVKTTWPDGSIRFAVLTANVPAAGTYPIVPALAAAGATLSPSLPAASATFSMAGVVYTATLPAAQSADRWLSGPLAYEGRSIVAPVSSADGQPHPFLRVIFDTRVYADANGRVDVTVENVLDQVGASTVTYDVAIAVNGAPAFTQADVEHYYLTRWRKVFEVGTGVRASITPDMTPFNVSRALPPYLPLVGTQVDPISDDGRYDILRSGTLDPNMPAHGGNPDLAPFPDWTARYLVHKDPAQRAFVLANGDLAGSWPVHVREPEGGPNSGVGSERFLSLNERPFVWYDERGQGNFMQDGTSMDYIKGTPLPIREYGSTDPGPGQSPLIPDNAHQPSLSYVPYLLTGDRYYAEEMAFWANYAMMRTFPADGLRGVGGVLANNEVRGYGWALRNIADAAAYYPDAAVSQYLSQKVQANLQWLDQNANEKSPDTNPLRLLWAEYPYRPEAGFISLWEQTYLAYAIDRANQQGFVGGLAHRDAITKLQLALFTSPDYPRESPIGTVWSAPYLLKAGTLPDPTSWDGFVPYSSMAEIASATVGNPDLQRDFAGYYGPEARLNLMMRIESGDTTAQEPYDYLFPFIGVFDSFCSSAYGGTDNADRSDLTCRSGWALDFYPPAAVVASVSCLPGSYLATPADAACTPAPAGSFVSITGATSATLCPAGTYSDVAGATACTSAPAGSFVSEAGATGPTQCAAGTYSEFPGTTGCTLAPAGSYVGTTGATAATSCAAGTYSNVAGAIACTPAPAGSFVSGIGATSATPAPAGSFVSGIGATSATFCAPGTYSSGPGAIACTAAPAGSFVSATGATSATFCAAGTYSNLSGTIACTPAPAGSFVSAIGATSATFCAPGTYSSGPGAIACTLAPAGTFVNAPGATSATPCEAGTYSPAGATACTMAPPGSFAAPGATSPTLCPAGTYSNVPGAFACTPAPAGSFVSATGATTATLCPAGNYSDVTGAIACTPAPAGSFVNAPGATSATLCASGTYSSTGATACTMAPAGSFAGPGATSATLCPAGTYSNVPGAVACTPAPAGSFVSATGATTATLCPAGKYSDMTGAIECTLAPAGSFVASPGATTATLCAAGSYSSGTGAIACTPAPAGSFVGLPGATTATLCPAGKYSDATGVIACTPAPAGSFVGLPGATTATLCPSGKYSDAAGAIACTPAPAGSFVGSPGATATTPCAVGTFSALAGATGCTPAPAGSFVDAPGATFATLCAAGTYSVAGATACTVAPAGSFVAPGATTATPCAVGAFSASAGATACTPAPAGSFVSTTGATSATLCAAGAYSNAPGASACILAPAGSFVGSPGATVTTPCAVGAFSASAGATACTPAPAGSFVGLPGATTATPCALGKFSDSTGATACTPAPAGSFVGSPGATTATPCALGRFSASTGAATCTPAPAGSFVGATGATGATLCAVGTYSNAAGAIACTSAPAGSFVNAVGATGATLCAAGTYSNVAGAIACTPAPAGSFVSVTGATGATLCAAGTYSNLAGAIACNLAPAGSFVSVAGATAPTPCPAGTTSLAGATSCAAIGTVTNPLSAFVVFSNDMTWLKEQTTVVTGDVGANTRAKHGHSGDEGNDGDADDVTVRIGQQVTMQQPGSRVVGDTVRLANKASVYNVVDNVLIDKSRKATINGTITTPMTIPFLTLPTLPTIAPGTAAIEVAKGSTRTLGPGAYGKVHVNAKATLILTGGLYQMLSLDVEQAATVIFRAATEVRIKDELATGNKARVIADPASAGLTAKDLMIYVAGTDDRCNHDGDDEESNDHGGRTVAHIGENNVVAANIYAPRGTVWIKSKTQATGAFVGDDVRIGQNVTLTLDSAFR